MEASPELRGDSHANDRADCCPAARVRRRWGLLRISQMGDRRRHRDFRAGADLCFRRIALALKTFSGAWVLERKRRRRIEWSLWIQFYASTKEEYEDEQNVLDCARLVCSRALCRVP